MKHFFRLSLTFLLLLATAMECAQILLRHFHMPVMWLNETIMFPAIWMYMLGCANASREDTQIAAAILPVLFPAPRFVALIDLCARLFSVVVSSWLTWHAVEYFLYSLKASRKTACLFLPMSIGETAMAAGMLLVAAYCLVHLFRSFGSFRRVFGNGERPS